MAKQVIVIESAKGLSLRGGMMVITDSRTGEVALRPIEDIKMIMIDHHSAKLTVPLIIQLVANNVGIVYCDSKHMPTAMMKGIPAMLYTVEEVGSRHTISLL